MLDLITFSTSKVVFENEWKSNTHSGMRTFHCCQRRRNAFYFARAIVRISKFIRVCLELLELDEKEPRMADIECLTHLPELVLVLDLRQEVKWYDAMVEVELCLNVGCHQHRKFIVGEDGIEAQAFEQLV